ncbi:hypothetical protein V8E53_008714 [Lactarius tabidus]
MTDLTSLVSPSTLYLPLAKETGLPRRFNRRSTLPFVPAPIVTVQMVDTDIPPRSPVRLRDESLLSPPPHTFRSRGHRRRRSSSAPPAPSSTPRKPSPENTNSIRSPDYSSLPPKSPESLTSLCRRGSSLTVVRPQTTLFRPRPFWRNTCRSAVTGTFYASSLHLVRRSTFIAAGLRFDKPIADLSALGVESRIGIVVLLPDILP